MSKKRFWGEHSSWEEAEKAWNEGAKEQEAKHPLKVLKSLPLMPGMTKETARNLKWKSLRWMITKDSGWQVTEYIMKRPFFYFSNLWPCNSFCKTMTYVPH